MKERAVNQVHADDAQRFLLFQIGVVQHPYVNEDFVRRCAGLALKTHPQPSMTLGARLETLGGDRVGEGEKGGVVRPMVLNA